MTADDWTKIVKVDDLKRISPEDISRTDQQWVNQWDEHWNTVDNQWRSQWLMGESESEIVSLHALLKLLRLIVPTVTIINGTETIVQYAHPKDVRTHIKGAAEILFMGELECVAESDDFLPAPDAEWQTTSSHLMQKMSEFLSLEEVTTGDEAMSRRAHAEQAIRALKSVELARNAFQIEEGEEIGTGSDDMALSQLSAELAHFAFSAGVHAQIALAKEVEQWAVKWQAEEPKRRKRKEDGRRGGIVTSTAFDDERHRVIQAMKARIDHNRRVHGAPNVAQAALHVFKIDKRGTSPAANRTIWYKYGRNTPKAK